MKIHAQLICFLIFFFLTILCYAQAQQLDAQNRLYIPDPAFREILSRSPLDFNIYQEGDDYYINKTMAEAIPALFLIGGEALSQKIQDATGIEGFIGLNTLLMPSNAFTTLNVSTIPSLNTLNVTGNPNLTCIQVPSSFDNSNIPSDWQKDETANYSKNCNAQIIVYLNPPLIPENRLYISDPVFLSRLQDSHNSSFTIYQDENDNYYINKTSAEATQELVMSGGDESSQKIQDATGIEGFTGLSSLFMSFNAFTTLNVSTIPSLSVLVVTNNPNLMCIQVPSSFDNSSIPPDWRKDETAKYSTNCNAQTIVYLNPQLPPENRLYIPDDILRNDLLLASSFVRSIQAYQDDQSRYYVNKADAVEVFSRLTLGNASNPPAEKPEDFTGIEGLTNLRTLNIYDYLNDASLTTLNLSTLTSLEYLNVSDNGLTSLDVSALTSLEYLNVSDNGLTSLDVSALTSLEYLVVSDNGLTSLDVSALTSLTTLNVTGNPQLTCVQVPSSFDNDGDIPSGWVRDGNTRYSTDCGATTIQNINPELPPENRLYIPDSQFRDGLQQPLVRFRIYEDDNGGFYIDKTRAASFNERLDLSNQNIQDLTGIEGFTSLRALVLINNSLTNLNLSMNTELELLDTQNNPDLTCIQLASSVFEDIPEYFLKDFSTRYSTDCSSSPTTTNPTTTPAREITISTIENKNAQVPDLLEFQVQYTATPSDMAIRYSLDNESIGKGMEIDEDGNFSWIVSQLGSHTVTITVSDASDPDINDTETFEINVDDSETTALSLKKPLKNTLRVSPVPTSNSVNLHMENKVTGNLVIRLRTLLGNLVWERTATKKSEVLEQTIDLSDLPKGIYMLEVVSEGQHWIKKIIKS